LSLINNNEASSESISSHKLDVLVFNTAVLEESFRGNRTNPVLKFIKERADPRSILLFKTTGKEPYGRTGLDVWPSEKNAVIEFGL